MQMPVIIDIVLIAVLLLFAVLGWRRGAFRSVIGIVVVAAALVGAGFVAQQGAPVVAKMVTPVISQQIETRFEEAAQSKLPSDTEAVDAEDAADWFSAAGFYHKTAEKLAEDTMTQVRETGQAMIAAAADSIIRAAASAILFFLSFFLLLIVLKVVSKILGLLTAVPGLHLADAIGGGLFGLIQGGLILFVVIWVMQFIGSGIPEELVNHAAILRFFVTLNPMMMLSGV